MTENRFDPIREIEKLGKSVGQVIEQGIQNVQKQVTPGRSFQVDIYEQGNALIIRTSPIDGIVPTSIEVNMEGKVLTIAGDTVADPAMADAVYLLRERDFTPFSRQFVIPLAVRASEARAKLKHNSLVITIPIDREAFTPIDIE